MNLKFGMCGFTIGARAYYKRFRVVEVQQTFYDPAPPETLKFFAAIERPEAVRLLWEPRGAWPDELILSLCNELGLVHVVDPFIRPSLTPYAIYWRLHGNRSHYARYTDDELRQIREWIPPAGDGDAYVMFNNVPRVHDVKRFRELGLEETDQADSTD